MEGDFFFFFWLSAEMTQPLSPSDLSMTKLLCFRPESEEKSAIFHQLSDCITVCMEGSIKFPPETACILLVLLMLKWLTYFFNQIVKRKYNYGVQT